ncbi:MAG TPA: cold shock domain-containing protein [Planctomycetota bacterium]|nr:cold shock domain-containing protein [Planctomycetota bacterium]HRR80919.1 cold shock domain-containing protein [Planctomycetota bacterium]HRT93861.1 cold shock domain-containing protein [Planctomycetota bacterium]
MAQGIVKWFDPKKGYGFITVDGQPDIFVHWRNIKDSEDFKTLEDGEAVQLDIVQGNKGLAAENVIRLA